MAVNKDPILKRCRYLGISPAVMGIDKKSNRNPNANSRKKISEYGTQLKEKQKLKFIYGVMEKPFRHYFELAEKMEGKAGDNLITVLESRLDNVAFRMGLASTRREARELVTHGHFTVNGQKVDIPSYRVSVGDEIALGEKSRSSVLFKGSEQTVGILEKTQGRTVPLWLEVSNDKFSAKVTRLPNPSDIDYEAETHLIVELYSK
ncbi:MAG: 30S ribosomal protein S4 [Oscillospiraceae bacterium]|nr:30S ribosomal protein S4 [Oscillospiraceae bacterium]